MRLLAPQSACGQILVSTAGKGPGLVRSFHQAGYRIYTGIAQQQLVFAHLSLTGKCKPILRSAKGVPVSASLMPLTNVHAGRTQKRTSSCVDASRVDCCNYHTAAGHVFLVDSLQRYA
eukprot:791250-Amorphochlora_amoeboformis.AAC.1